MATATQNTDTSDLLILSDDTDMIKVNETPMVEENISTMDELITFSDDSTAEEGALDLGVTMEEPTLDLGATAEEGALDLGVTMEEPTLDLGATADSLEKKEEKESTVFNLEDATAGYIKQLESRKDQITLNIESDDSIIAIKESKIKELRSEIADYKGSIKDLNSENDEIDNKISLVSGGKAVNNIKSTTSSRVHNVKRKKAA